MEAASSTQNPAFRCPNCNYEYQVGEYQPEFSQLEHLYQTNDTPLPAEQSSALSLVQSIEDDLSRTITDIQHVQDTLQALKAKRARIETHLESSRRLLAPIRKVPRDIIGEILLHAVGAYDAKRRNVPLNTRQAPWTYARVCRLWREESLSRPSIWTHLAVVIGYYGFNSPDALAALLSRSQDHDLVLTLDLDAGGNTAKSDVLLNTLFSHSSRWGTVSLKLTEASLERLEKLNQRVPRLTNLRISLSEGRIYSSTRPSTASTVITPFEHAPALRKVTVSGLGDIAKIKLPWGQMTHFSARSTPPSWWSSSAVQGMTLSLLDKMPNLEAYDFTDDLRGDMPEPVTLKHLRSISFRKTHSSQFQHLRLPALSTIHMFLYDPTFSLPVEGLQSLINRSQCTITKLGLHLEWTIWPDSKNNILELFRMLPALETLEFRSKPPSELFSALNRDSSILPKLKVLQFDALLLTTEDSDLVDAVNELLEVRETITQLLLLNGDAIYVDRQLKRQRLSTFGEWSDLEIVQIAYDSDDLWQDGRVDGLWREDEEEEEDEEDEDDEGWDEPGYGFGYFDYDSDYDMPFF